MTRTKLQKILNKLDNTNSVTLKAIREFEDGVKTLREKLQQEIQVSTLDEVNLKINKLRKSINPELLITSLNSLETRFNDSISSILNDIESKGKELKNLISTSESNSNDGVRKLSNSLEVLRAMLNGLVESNNCELIALNKRLTDALDNNKKFATKTDLEPINESLEGTKNLLNQSKNDIIRVGSDIEKTRTDFFSRLSQLPHGGNANRNISIGVNSSVLSRYTDINLKAGSNVTITYVNNNTTKNVDVTIASSGGGSVGGTIRSVNNIATSQVAGRVSGTDYVYICSAGVQVTLPSAATNTNLYTIKNIAASSILVSRDGTDTIESDTSLTLATQYTAVDLISDGTNNWNIT